MNDLIVDNGTLAARVTQKLREEIIRKDIEAGSRITIKEISERYGVSSMPVREAFRTLEGEKLLQINAYKGAIVLNIDVNFVRDVYGLLRALEYLIYESALPDITEDTIQELRRFNARIKQLDLTEEGRRLYVDYNTAFHSTIMKHGHNAKALELYDYYHGLASSFRKSFLPQAERVVTARKEHDLLIDALESKNKNALRDVVDAHVMNSLDSFLEQYSQKEQ